MQEPVAALGAGRCKGGWARARERGGGGLAPRGGHGGRQERRDGWEDISGNRVDPDDWRKVGRGTRREQQGSWEVPTFTRRLVTVRGAGKSVLLTACLSAWRRHPTGPAWASRGRDSLLSRQSSCFWGPGARQAGRRRLLEV